ncbi:NAD(P)/FAD-dependent oxidoreductase [Ectothiorhodospira variabilis]|uniref:NAD(P)/FAD-dependent oxidoreductase n=1 Tax=Ectothiorhodospira variabilis TaxID=505694 RepID=UPI001EFA8EEF|nr:NAD(P)/FAD-dependent oxidoreductase [Ectothiorhodospira variabilis]MCG5498920.1 NAD(P)/FAD-dependent oxidoreductase [Ectothiorhodospira variabilis]
MTLISNSANHRHRVVILGAGFAGLSAALKLARAPVDIVIIDRHNYHLFQPLLYQVATAALSPADIAAPIRGIVGRFPNVRVLLDTVEDVDRRTRRVYTAGGRHVPYDDLIVATGATHNYFGKDHWQQWAPGLKRIEDAIELRRRILLAFEQAEMEEDIATREALMTFVVVGGGPAGVEMAGAVAELARFTLARDFRNIQPENARVVLVDANERLLRPFPPSLSRKAAKTLGRLGVELILNARVDGMDANCVRIGSRVLPTHTVIWSAGVRASPAGRWLKVETDPAGRIPVDETLRLPQDPNIYVLGDVASHRNPDGSHTPGVAPAAKQMGRYAARHIASRLRDRPAPGPFRFRNPGQLATIGRHSALGHFGRLKVSGYPGWWLWGLAHIYFLIGFRNRLMVAANWFWSYLTFGRGVRLITGDMPSIAISTRETAHPPSSRHTPTAKSAGPGGSS